MTPDEEVLPDPGGHPQLEQAGVRFVHATTLIAASTGWAIGLVLGV